MQNWIRFIPRFIRIRLEGRLNLQKIIGNTGWLFFYSLLRMGVGVFVMTWMARYLGPEKFGIWNYSLAFVTLFSVFATLGLDSRIIIRDIVRDSEYKNEILGTTFALKVLGGILTLLLSVGVIIFIRPDDKLTHWVVGIIAAGMIFQSFDTIDSWFQSKVLSKYTVYVKSAAYLLMSLAKIAAILLSASLIVFAGIASMEIFLCSIGLLIVYWINGQSIIEWRIRWSRVKSLLNQGWPMIFSTMASIIFMKIDMVMIGQMLGGKAVGIYSVAARISELWYFIPVAIVSSVYPSIVEAKKVGEELYHHRLKHLFNLMVALSYSIIIPVTLLNKWIITLLFGKYYIEAGPVLAIHIWSAVFVFLGVSRGSYLITEGLLVYIFLTTALGAVVNIILNIFLIPSYGILGAAIATLVAYFMPIFSCLFYRKTYKIGIMMLKSLVFIRN